MSRILDEMAETKYRLDEITRGYRTGEYSHPTRDNSGLRLADSESAPVQSGNPAKKPAICNSETANLGTVVPTVGTVIPASGTQIGGEHYRKFAMQPSEFIHRNRLGWCEGNAIKYLCRWREKNGLQDLKKARHYIDLLIEWEGGNEN